MDHFSAFMLHQAAEQSLRAMLMISIGLRVISHNIDKMLRYASMFTHEAAAAFQKNNKRNKHLVNLLNEAYLGSRYKNDYNITCEHLLLLTQKVKAIKALFQKYKPGS